MSVWLQAVAHGSRAHRTSEPTGSPSALKAILDLVMSTSTVLTLSSITANVRPSTINCFGATTIEYPAELISTKSFPFSVRSTPLQQWLVATIERPDRSVVLAELETSALAMTETTPASN